ncbi:hypothetical protein V8F33_013715 [Rhypophila sp. PSN 637]
MLRSVSFSRSEGRSESPTLNSQESSHLGIDIGSVATRLVISSSDENGNSRKPIIVQNKLADIIDPNKHLGRVEFPSDCSVDGKSLLVHPDIPREKRISAKYLIYRLDHDSREMDEEFLDEFNLFTVLGDLVTPDNAQAALREHISALIVRVKDVCKTNRLRLHSVTITVPAHWSVSLVDRYLTLVKDSFHTQYHGESTIPVKVCFESQAIGRCVFDAENVGWKDEIGYSPDVVLVLDCGGHSASSTIFARTSSGEQARGMYTFFDMQSSKGAGGGCETFLRETSNWCTNKMLFVINRALRHQDHDMHSQSEALTADIKNKFLGDFVRRLKTCRTDDHFLKDFDFSYELRTGRNVEDGTPRIFHVKVTATCLSKFWESAMKNTKRMIESQLRAVTHHLVNLREHGVSALPLILVSGGTARAPMVRSFLKQQCQMLGFQGRLFFAEDLDSVPIATTSIALGASLIGESRGCVQDFLETGPARFAVQMRQSGEAVWDNSAEIIGQGFNFVKKAVFHVEEGDELQLLCSPFAASSSTRFTRKGVGMTRARRKIFANIHRGFYNLIPLLRPLPFKARVIFQFQWIHPDQSALPDGMRQMRISYQTRARTGGQRELSATHQAEPIFHFDAACNCMLPLLRDDLLCEQTGLKFTVIGARNGYGLHGDGTTSMITPTLPGQDELDDDTSSITFNNITPAGRDVRRTRSITATIDDNITAVPKRPRTGVETVIPTREARRPTRTTENN